MNKNVGSVTSFSTDLTNISSRLRAEQSVIVRRLHGRVIRKKSDIRETNLWPNN